MCSTSPLDLGMQAPHCCPTPGSTVCPHPPGEDMGWQGDPMSPPRRDGGTVPRRLLGMVDAAGGLTGGEEVQSWGHIWGFRHPAVLPAWPLPAPAAVPRPSWRWERVGPSPGATQGCSQARTCPSARAMPSMMPLPSRNPAFCRSKRPQVPSPGPSAPCSASGSWGRAGGSAGPE